MLLTIFRHRKYNTNWFCFRFFTNCWILFKSACRDFDAVSLLMFEAARAVLSSMIATLVNLVLGKSAVKIRYCKGPNQLPCEISYMFVHARQKVSILFDE